MFTFLNSIILSALLAALIPLLIHLFNKQKTKKIKFSSLRFLKKLEKRRLKKVKIYQILLIVIRTLLIVMLVLAFARPTFSGSWSILQEPSASTTAVVILDDGLSMRQYDFAGNRYNRAIQKFGEVSKSFKQEDRVLVLKTSNSGIDLSDTLDIQSQECSYLIGDLNTGLLKAAKHFEKNQNINKELHIISDFETLPEQFEGFAKNNRDIKIYLENINESGTGNISIENLEFENNLFEINKPLNIKLYVRNHSSTEAKNVSTHLFINDKRMAQNNSTITSGEQKTIPLTFIPKNHGWNVGYVEINDDDLLADNKYYFSFKIPEKAKVLFVDNKPSLYLSSAIETINKSANIEIVSEKYNSIARQSFFEYDVIILSNFPEIPDVIISRLKSFINSGKGIILSPGDNTVPSFFNSSLSTLFGNLKIVNINKTENNTGYFALKNIQRNNPILSELFREDNPEIALPKFKKYFRMTNIRNYQSLLQLNNGDPFLMYSDENDLNSFIMSSYFDDSWTDLQYKGIFIPMLIKMIKYSAFRMDFNKNQIVLGKESVITTKRGNTDQSYELLLSESEKNKITPIFSGANVVFNLQDFIIPGNYRIQQGPEILSVISANVEASTLGTNLLGVDELIEDNDNIELINEDENISEKVQEARFGEEIWKYVVALALLVLLIEGLVVKKIEGKI